MTTFAKLNRSERIEVCRRFVHESLYNARNLARLLGISLRHLERYFEADLGRPPQHWLNEQRMAAARHLLVEGRQIKWVSCELGFKQASHFCHQFKQHYGCTASQLAAKAAPDAGDVLPAPGERCLG
jgi:AraC-like DNA-binding protein